MRVVFFTEEHIILKPGVPQKPSLEVNHFSKGSGCIAEDSVKTESTRPKKGTF